MDYLKDIESKWKFWAMDMHGNIASNNKFEWINKKEGTFKVIVSE